MNSLLLSGWVALRVSSVITVGPGPKYTWNFSILNRDGVSSFLDCGYMAPDRAESGAGENIYGH